MGEKAKVCLSPQQQIFLLLLSQGQNAAKVGEPVDSMTFIPVGEERPGFFCIAFVNGDL